MIKVNTFKNQSVSSLVFDANSIILVKQTERPSNDGGIDTTVKVLTINGLKDTKEVSLIKLFLLAIVSESKVRDEINGESDLTNIKQISYINTFLTNNFTIFRTNGDGKLSKAVVSEQPLNKTCLKLRAKYGLMKCDPNMFKDTLSAHAKVFLAQARFFTTINEKLDKYLKITEDIAKEIVAAPKSEKKEDKKAA